jgi:hypothetical protein
LSPPVLSFGIQTHPSREQLAVWLAGKIGGHVDIVLDPDPDGEWHSPWRTFRRVLDETPETATHRVQIQDDAAVCDGFRAAVEKAVETQPDKLICLFVAGRPHGHVQAVMSACNRDVPWARISSVPWVPAVSTVWPRALIDSVCSYVDRQRWGGRFVADDEILGRWATAESVEVLATVPSLVEHPDQVPSLIGFKTSYGANPDRVAACYIGDCEGCAAEIDWSIGP